MNERIKELWEECKTPDWSKDNPSYDHEKFAELIVGECAMFVVSELEGKVGSLIADTTANRLEKYFDFGV